MLMVLMSWFFFLESRFSFIKSKKKIHLEVNSQPAVANKNRARPAQLRGKLSKHSFQPSLTPQQSLCYSLRDDILDKDNYKQTMPARQWIFHLVQRLAASCY